MNIVRVLLMLKESGKIQINRYVVAKESASTYNLQPAGDETFTAAIPRFKKDRLNKIESTVFDNKHTAVTAFQVFCEEKDMGSFFLDLYVACEKLLLEKEEELKKQRIGLMKIKTQILK